MNDEVRFKNDIYNYYNRAVGIIKHNDKYLIMKVNDSTYYHIPGGHLEINEDSLTGVKKELKEELGYTVKTAKLFCTKKIFIKKKVLNFME